MLHMTENARKMFNIIMSRYIDYKKMGLRKGQSIYNASSVMFSEVSKLNGTEFDCFYDDEKVDIFLDKLYSIIKDGLHEG